MEYYWEYIERKLNSGEFCFHGKEIGVLCENNIDFFITIRNKYPGGKIHLNSQYLVNNHMFHSISHTNQYKTTFTDLIQTEFAILNPFYGLICHRIQDGKSYYYWNNEKYNPQDWTFYHDKEYYLFL